MSSYLQASGPTQILNSIARCVVRTFYSPSVIIIMDTMVHIRRSLTARDLSHILGISNTSFVECILRGMSQDHLIRADSKKNASSRITGSKTLTKEEKQLQVKNALGGVDVKETFIYYIDYAHLVNTLRYRLSKVSETVTAQTKQLQDNFKDIRGDVIEGEFWTCPLCHSCFIPFDIFDLPSKNGIPLCKLCPSVPELKYFPSTLGTNIVETPEDSSIPHPVVLEADGSSTQPSFNLNQYDILCSFHILNSLMKKAQTIERIPAHFGREQEFQDELSLEQASELHYNQQDEDINALGERRFIPDAKRRHTNDSDEDNSATWSAEQDGADKEDQLGLAPTWINLENDQEEDESVSNFSSSTNQTVEALPNFDFDDYDDSNQDVESILADIDMSDLGIDSTTLSNSNDLDNLLSSNIDLDGILGGDGGENENSVSHQKSLDSTQVSQVVSIDPPPPTLSTISESEEDEESSSDDDVL